LSVKNVALAFDWHDAPYYGKPAAGVVGTKPKDGTCHAFSFLTASILTPKRRLTLRILLKPSLRGELEITEAIQILLDEGFNVGHDFIEGWWKDTGKPEDILETNRLVLDEMKPKIEGSFEDDSSIQGRVYLQKGSVIRRGALVRGPAVIGEATVVQPGAYIGPYTSIGNNCKINRGELENSIVMENCMIDVEDRIADSLIGTNSKIVSSAGNTPKVRRFILRESSTVLL
jgi:glucose-1-phosphate thymidylyltransferase